MILPYYRENGVAIYHGDCRQVLPLLMPLAVDCVIADPPYQETSFGWDRWPVGWLDVVGQVAAKACSLWCFGSFRMFIERRDEFGRWRFVQDIVWEKHNGSGFAKDRFRRVHETAAHFVPVGCKWGEVYKLPQVTLDARAKTVNRARKAPGAQGAIAESTYTTKAGGPRLRRSVLQVRSMHRRALHPTEKPQGILTPLLGYSCRPGGVVLDPVCGSGSTLAAARSLGMQAIGVEADERYCEIAAKRLSIAAAEAERAAIFEGKQ